MPERQAASHLAGAQARDDQPAAADLGDRRTGVTGFGIITRAIHFDAGAGYPVVAIASRRPARRVAVAPMLAETGVA